MNHTHQRGNGLSDIVLLLDPSDERRDETARKLIHNGYKTFKTSTLEEALQKFKHVPANVVVASSETPQQEDITTYQRFQEIDHLVPIFFIGETIDGQVSTSLLSRSRRPAGVFQKDEFYSGMVHILDSARKKYEKEQRHLIGTDFRDPLFDLLKWMVDPKKKRLEYLSNEHAGIIYRKMENDLGDAIVHIHDRVFMHGVARFTDDCAGGVLSVLDENARLDKEEKLFLIKRTHQKSDVSRIFQDYDEYGIDFNLPEPIFIHKKPNSPHYYLITEMFPATDNARVLTLLKSNPSFYAPLISGIVEEILDTRSKWYHATKWETKQGTGTQVKSDYVKNLMIASENIRSFVHTPKKSPLASKEYLAPIFSSMIDQLGDHGYEVWGRVMDCSPSNSGLLTWRVKPVMDDIDKMINGTNQYTRYQFDKTLLKDAIRFWDIPHKSGHVLEDFFHIVDSFEAGLAEHDKIELFDSYVESIFQDKNDVEEIKKALWSDFFITGFYRNFRKMDLVLTKYAGNNELEHEHLKINQNTYISRRTDYEKKIDHYCHQATKYMISYHQFIGMADIRTDNWDESKQRVGNFFTEFAQENEWDRNPEIQEGKLYQKTPEAYQIAATLNDNFCGQRVDWKAIRSEMLERILEKDVIRSH